MYNGLDIFENGIEPDYKCSNSAAESTILVEQETSRYSTTPTIGQEMVIDTNYSDIYSNMAGSLTKLYYFLQRSQLQSL